MRTRSVLTCVLVLHGWPSFGGAQSAAERLRVEGPAGWQRYLEYAQTLEQRFTSVTRTIQNGKEEPVRYPVTWSKMSATGAVRVFEKTIPGAPGQVEAINPQYRFKLQRMDHAQAWAVQELTLADRSDAFVQNAEKFREDVLRWSTSILTVYNLWLPDVIKDPDFKVRNAVFQSSDKGNEGKFVRVDFDYPKTRENYPVRGALPISKGWAVFDSRCDWVLKEYEARYEGSDGIAVIHRVNFYDIGPERHPRMKRATQVYRARSIDGTEILERSSEQTVAPLERPDMPISEFSLSAFGLPEPTANSSAAKPRRYLCLIAVGAAALAVSIGTAEAHRRREKGKYDGRF